MFTPLLSNSTMFWTWGGITHESLRLGGLVENQILWRIFVDIVGNCWRFVFLVVMRRQAVTSPLYIDQESFKLCESNSGLEGREYSIPMPGTEHVCNHSVISKVVFWLVGGHGTLMIIRNMIGQTYWWRRGMSTNDHTRSLLLVGSIQKQTSTIKYFNKIIASQPWNWYCMWAESFSPFTCQ